MDRYLGLLPGTRAGLDLGRRLSDREAESLGEMGPPHLSVHRLRGHGRRCHPTRPGGGRHPPNNPLGIPGTGDMLDSMTGWLGTLLGVIALVALVDVFLRFRRSVGVERLQFRWFFIASPCSRSCGSEHLSRGVRARRRGFRSCRHRLRVVGNGTAAAIGVAITRHGLYEIDRIISSTVSDAVVVGLLAAVYLGR